jgi:hypothetical protein
MGSLEIEGAPPPKFEIFVKENQEEDYLSSNHIKLYRFSNGSTLISGLRPVDDAAFARIKFEYPTGAFFDPPGKSGLSHLFEHFYATEPLNCAQENGAKTNAQTSGDKLMGQLSGPSHPKARDYGVWPVLPIWIKNLSGDINPTMEQLGNEKKVVINEINERYNFDNRADLFCGTVIYAQNNPSMVEPGGTIEEIKTITKDDVANHFKKAIVPSGLFTRLKVEGSRVAWDDLNTLLVDFHTSHPRSRTKPMVVYRSWLDRINPDFHQGQIYSNNLKEKNNFADAHLVWLSEDEGISPNSDAQYALMDLANTRLHRFVRSKGFYSSDACIDPLGVTKVLSQLSMRLPSEIFSDDLLKGLVPPLLDCIFGSLNNKDFENVVNLAHRRLDATIPSLSTRMAQIEYGLRFYNRIIDSEKCLEIHRDIAANDVKRWRDFYMDTPPAILIYG